MSTRSSQSQSPGASQTINAGQGVSMAVAGIIAAAVGLVALVISARVLSIEDNSRFNAFWSVLFLLFGIASGIAVETTRSVSNRTLGSESLPSEASGLSTRIVGLTTFASSAVLLGATLPAWRHAIPALTSDVSWQVCAAIAVGVTGYAGQSVLVGSLAGVREWNLYATITVAEALTRLALMVVAGLAHADLVGLVWACVAAEFVWLVVLACAPKARAAFRNTLDAVAPVFIRRVLGAMAGQGASAVLVVGFPWLVGLTTSNSVYLSAAPLMLAVSLTRAPLMVPLSTFYNVAISLFTRNRSSGLRSIGKILGLMSLLGIALAGVAWLVGPFLLRLIRHDYSVSGPVLAGLTIGATCIAIVSVTGIVCQSLASYRSYLIGWLVAVAVAVALLLTPWSIKVRVLVSLIGGPLCGSVVHLALLHRATSLHPDNTPS